MYQDLRPAPLTPVVRLIVVLFALLSAANATAQVAGDAATDIREALHAQAAAWNHGDIPAFMATYWKSPHLRFASDGSITHGWQPTLERYLKRYPDQATMGTLTFADVEVTLLAADAAVVFGRWELARAADRPHGLFTLVWRRLPEGWRIVSDHTSSARN